MRGRSAASGSDSDISPRSESGDDDDESDARAHVASKQLKKRKRAEEDKQQGPVMLNDGQISDLFEGLKRRPTKRAVKPTEFFVAESSKDANTRLGLA